MRIVLDVTALHYWQTSCDQQNVFVLFNSMQLKVSEYESFRS